MTLYRHLLVTGQSNALAGETADPQWDAEVAPLGNTNPRAFILDPYGTMYPSSCYAWPWTDTNPGQGIQRTIVDRFQRCLGTDPASIHTRADGGRSYSQLKKGTAIYALAMDCLTQAVAKRTMQGDTLEVLSLHIDHGEAEAATSAATYAGYLNEWLTDYTADVQAITGQTKKLLGVMTACGSVTGPAAAVIDVHRTNARFIAAGAKYALPKGTATHQTAVGHFRNGEYHAKALAYTYVMGRRWEPVHPISITRNTNVVTIRFNVPVGQLAFDASEAAPPTAANPSGETKSLYTNRGFSFSDSTTSATITSVAITDTDTVTITLSTTPTGTNQRISYGDGNLHDTDPFPSAYDGRPLWNWCMPFNDPIGFSYTPLDLPADVSYAAAATTASSLVEEYDDTWWTRNLEMWGGSDWLSVAPDELA